MWLFALFFVFFFFKQKTAYEMRISDWSSDVCSSDLRFLEVGFDPWAFGVDDADHRQARHHVTADVRYFAGDAVDRRAHFGAFEIQLGLVQGGQRRDRKSVV